MEKEAHLAGPQRWRANRWLANRWLASFHLSLLSIYVLVINYKLKAFRPFKKNPGASVLHYQSVLVGLEKGNFSAARRFWSGRRWPWRSSEVVQNHSRVGNAVRASKPPRAHGASGPSLLPYSLKTSGTGSASPVQHNKPSFMVCFISLARAATTPRCRGCQTETSARNAPGSSTNQGLWGQIFSSSSPSEIRWRARNRSGMLAILHTPSDNQPRAALSQLPWR